MVSRLVSQAVGILALVLLHCAAIAAYDQFDGSDKKADAMSKYDETVRQLQSPETWCEGAEALVHLGEARALVPLLRAFESRSENRKQCLYDAMEKLGAEKEARSLIAQASVEDRRIGVRLMELFPSDEQLPMLEQVARSDRNEMVRLLAIHTLGLQKQTPRWEAVMVRLLEAPDGKLREAAIDNLATRYTDSAREALRARLSRETSAELRAKLAAAIETNIVVDPD